MFLFWVGYYSKFYEIFIIKMNIKYTWQYYKKNLEYLLNENNFHDKYLVLYA